jgi:hypothetical protein
MQDSNEDEDAEENIPSNQWGVDPAIINNTRCNSQDRYEHSVLHNIDGQADRSGSRNRDRYQRTGGYDRNEPNRYKQDNRRNNRQRADSNEEITSGERGMREAAIRTFEKKHIRELNADIPTCTEIEIMYHNLAQESQTQKGHLPSIGTVTVPPQYPGRPSKTFALNGVQT